MGDATPHQLLRVEKRSPLNLRIKQLRFGRGPFKISFMSRLAHLMLTQDLGTRLALTGHTVSNISAIYKRMYARAVGKSRRERESERKENGFGLFTIERA
jgi:hypothetical protein